MKDPARRGLLFFGVRQAAAYMLPPLFCGEKGEKRKKITNSGEFIEKYLHYMKNMI